MPTFSPQQDAALKAVSAWLNDRPGVSAPQVFRLFGYAGTGKTTLARHIADEADGKVLFAAFTGKAAQVMRQKGCYNASTIHSLIYKPRDLNDEVPSFELWDEAPASKAKLIIIDECSMVDAELGRDLLSFGVPLLVLGDPAQLPPIQGGGFFTNAEPDAMLTEVHRQAKDNPIVRLSMDVREGRPLVPGAYGETQIVEKAELDPQRVIDAEQVLVGRNTTRRAYNMRLRERRGIEDPLPVSGDRLVCLRNNHDKGLLNGAIWHVADVGEVGADRITFTLDPEMDGSPTTVEAHACYFRGEEPPFWERKAAEEFDYGYALTVHKAQGSQWDDVILFDESWVFREDRNRWLYTGITRAAERVTVVRM